MAVIDDLAARKALYVAAEAKILVGQEYTISDGVITRRMRRADLADVQRTISQLDAEIGLLGGGTVAARRIYRIVPGC